MNYEEALAIISSPEFAYARAAEPFMCQESSLAQLYAREDGFSRLLGICNIADARAILRERGWFVEPWRL